MLVLYVLFSDVFVQGFSVPVVLQAVVTDVAIKNLKLAFGAISLQSTFIRSISPTRCLNLTMSKCLKLTSLPYAEDTHK